jgi:hypothetical protein
MREGLLYDYWVVPFVVQHSSEYIMQTNEYVLLKSYRLGVAPPTFNRSTIICDIQPDRAAVI